jgi:hypothetical protein
MDVIIRIFGARDGAVAGGRGFDSRWCHWNFSLT